MAQTFGYNYMLLGATARPILAMLLSALFVLEIECHGDVVDYLPTFLGCARPLSEAV